MILLFVIFCSGCAQPQVVEDLGFVHSIGYDLNEAEDAEETGVLVVTVAIPQITPTAETDRELLTTVAHTSKQARAKMARKTNRELVSGQLRTALFGMNLAEKGFFDTMDTLKRDYTIGLNIKIIVVNGSSKELLLEDYPEHPRTSRYLFELIDKEAKSYVTVDTSLHEFMRDYYDDGGDAIAPIVKVGINEIIMDGIGLFDGDRLVMKVDPIDARPFMMLHGDYLGGDITKEIKLEEEEKESYLYITFSTIQSWRKVNVKSPEEIDIDLKVEGSIDEYTGHLELSDDEVQKEIEKKLAKHIEKVCKHLIHEMQQKNTDSLGIGKFVRNSSKYKEWQEMNWKEEIYPHAKINVNATVKLKGFGGVK